MSKKENIEQKKRVFLGGTCNNSTWRAHLKPMLEIDFFDPVVEDWTEECMLEEQRQREVCDYCLYVISPKMTGTYSIAEAVDDSNKRPNKTIFCILTAEGDVSFDEGQIKSLTQVGRMIEGNGGYFCTTLVETAHYLNSYRTNQEIINSAVIYEKRSLDVKIKSLSSLLKSNQFTNLNEKDLSLLQIQELMMNNYSEVLQARIDGLRND